MNESAATPIGSVDLLARGPDGKVIPRGKRIGRTLADAERDAEAAKLREQGWSLRQIGRRYGVSHTTAGTWVDRALRAVPVKNVTELRRAELGKLDTVEAALMETILHPPAVVASNGNVVVSVRNADAATRAADALVRVSARRARLLGLDAPALSASMKFDEDYYTNEIKKLLAVAFPDPASTIQGQVELSSELTSG